MARLEVESSCLVGMASNSSPISRTELTPWDLQLLLLDPIQKGILFHKPQSLQTLIDHLKHSLSRTLDFFPPLAGRLATVQNDDATTSFFVDCNNAGAEFVHAVAGSVSISDILEPTYIPEILSSFFPLNGIANRDGVSKPLLAVQLTELVNGLFIACTANHAVVDGISFWHFFNSWSEISSGFESVSKPPVFKPWFPPNVQNHPIHLPPLKRNQLPDFDRPPLLDRVFHFSKESLSKLKGKANSEAGTDKISSLQALSAYLWWSATRCGHSSRIQEARFIMMVDSRARLHLPDGYFGNAAFGATLTSTEAELLQRGFGYAALKINELVGQQTKEAITELMKDWVRNPRLIGEWTSPASNFVISSSPRHNVYGNDFGWGKPVAVRSGKVHNFNGKMTMFPAPSAAGGIDVEVCLAPETLQAMENDTEFMVAFNV